MAATCTFDSFNACYERCASSARQLTNPSFGDSVVATALLYRILHYSIAFPIESPSYRLCEHADLFYDHLCNRASSLNSTPTETPRRRLGDQA
ncbi:ATP-binding protein [Candidatus Burkholderia verschuerenii]|uniref:ATP-binding protein n=1 Tax=Candidatus Burkholderia verschuerenii TaxID=242163 RepID=UPI0022B66A41|nr:ATP-binding protein [Candidatus Burkholderia verschuerenii]